MPRLSLYNPQKSNNYRYLDRVIKEQYQVGGTDLLVHKYLGPANTGPSADLTQPQQVVPTATAIQDLMFLETRDRTYDPNVYRIRGHYQVSNLDFDLSQFGLFLNNDTIFITVHYNDMIDLIGRKLMVSDVFELPHLTDYHPLNDTLPVSLRRFYQVTDANFASEGYSQTWYPHLWRIKAEPLVDSQQFQDIMNVPTNTDNYMGNYDPTKEYPPGYTVTYGGKVYTPVEPGPVPAGVYPPDPAYWKEDTDNPTLGGIISEYQKNIEINDAIIDEATRVVPQTGYRREQLYLVPTYLDGQPAPPVNVITSRLGGPSLGTGVISTFSSPSFSAVSFGVRITPTSGAMSRAGSRIVLSTGFTLPDTTDTGSGRVFGDSVLTAQVGSAATGPYGTTDNTYSTADQYIKFTVSANEVAPASNTISLIEWSDELKAGLLIRGTVYSSNGTAQSIFKGSTRIVSVNALTKTITTNNPTTCRISAGQALEVSYTFTGTVSSEMDYRADCDPRFQFIRRASPRSFGYINGYMTGDGTAPNGEPVGHGVAFPAAPNVGDYFLRIDYLPQRLFRFSGTAWKEISQKVRTGKGLASDSQSQRASFVNNNVRTPTADGKSVPERQSLSQALRIKPD